MTLKPPPRKDMWNKTHFSLKNAIKPVTFLRRFNLSETEWTIAAKQGETYEISGCWEEHFLAMNYILRVKTPILKKCLLIPSVKRKHPKPNYKIISITETVVRTVRNKTALG